MIADTIDITLETPVEELVARHPAAVGFLMEHGIRCIRCGEPLWGSLDDAMREKDIPEPRRAALLALLRERLVTEEKQ